MVSVDAVGFLSDIRGQSTYRPFPESELRDIRSAVEAVPRDLFLGDDSGTEIRRFDAHLGGNLPEYEYEHAGDGGRNPACKLWENQGFDHSVDLYQPDARIAIEVEKSERKRVSDDILKFIKGGKSQRDGRQTIEFGCLVVPTNYRGSGNIYQASLRTLEFIRSILFVEDIAVVGYEDPRWA